MKNIILNTVLLLFLIAFLLFGCKLEDPSEGINVDDVITLSIQYDTILADLESYAILTAKLGENIKDNQEITFYTDEGTFAGPTEASGKEYSAKTFNKEVTAKLISSNQVQDNVILTIKLDEFSQTRTINFKRSYPEYIKLKTDRLVVKNNRIDIANLTVELNKDIGEASNESIIFFEIIAPDSIKIDLDSFIISNGEIGTTNLKSGNGTNGIFTVVASSNSLKGLISDTLTFEIID